MAKKPASPDDIMSPAEMKPILAIAKRGDPVSAVIGLSKDKDGVILLDKKVKPKALLAMLRKQAEQAGLEIDRASLRFGTAAIDDDGKLVTFTLNKEAPGAYELKMVVPLRKAGYSKVAFTVDGNLENEGEQPAAQTAEAETPAPPAAATSQTDPEPPPAPPEAVEDALTRSQDSPAPTAETAETAAPAETPPVAQGAATPEGPGRQTPDVPDIKTLSQRAQTLGGMVPGAIQKAPGLRDNLVKLTTEAIRLIKAGDAMSAALTLDVLEDELQRANGAAQSSEAGASGPATAPGAAPGLPAAALTTLTKSKLAWRATRQAVETQLDQLHKKMAEAYDGHGFAADLERVFKSKVEPMLEKFDHSLADVLDEVSNAANPAEEARLVTEAVKVIERYESFLGSEPLIRQLDANPFVPLRIETTLTKTLEALGKSVRDVARQVESVG